jgi:hypothetical protein
MKLYWGRPVARSACCVFKTGAQAVGVARLKWGCGQMQRREIRCGFAVRPDSVKFVVGTTDSFGGI